MNSLLSSVEVLKTDITSGDFHAIEKSLLCVQKEVIQLLSDWITRSQVISDDTANMDALEEELAKATFTLAYFGEVPPLCLLEQQRLLLLWNAVRSNVWVVCSTSRSVLEQSRQKLKKKV